MLPKVFIPAMSVLTVGVFTLAGALLLKNQVKGRKPSDKARTQNLPQTPTRKEQTISRSAPHWTKVRHGKRRMESQRQPVSIVAYTAPNQLKPERTLYQPLSTV